MKKMTAVFLSILILMFTLVSAPAGAWAKDVNNDEGMYEVTDEVYADAYMLVNLDDDTYPVIAQKNKDKLKYPASLTKIVTAIVAINNVSDLQAKTTVSQSAYDSLLGTGAQVAGLKVGEELTIEQLLYLTMVHSACDACEVLAEYVSGSVPEFVKLMNNWVKSIGCENTNFTNCDGLHDDNHYTTVADMELITIEAMKNETFYKIATTQQYVYDDYTFVHTNFMLDKFHITYYYEYAEGIKTGSTTEAGYCVITKASKNGYNYLAIVMDSPKQKIDGIETKCSFIDAKTLFEWAFNSLKYSMVLRQNDVVEEVPVISGKDADTVQLVAEKDVNTIVPVALDPSAVIIKPIDMPESVEAPIAQGEKICSAEVIYGNKTIATVNLVSASEIELSTFLKVWNAIKDFFSNKAVLAVILILIAAVIAYIIFFAIKLKKHEDLAAQKRRRREEAEEKENREYNEKHRKDDGYLPPPKR